MMLKIIYFNDDFNFKYLFIYIDVLTLAVLSNIFFWAIHDIMERFAKRFETTLNRRNRFDFWNALFRD